ncbi:MAG: TM2 domain-containing protein [Chitinophagaceae bacterium]
MRKFIITLSIAIYTIACMNILNITDSFAAFPITEKTATATIPEVASNQKNEVAVSSVKAEAVKHNKAKSALDKSQLAAALLCFFLGGLGIHRFYLGYTWQGIVQLLTGGGCGIWALIDFIRILTGDLGPKDSSYDRTL